MKLLVFTIGLFIVLTEGRFRNFHGELAFPKELMNDPVHDPVGECMFNCNNAIDSRNKCVDGKCECGQGFHGKYCTCENLCSNPFGTCNNDAAGSCSCTGEWKGRNCNCPVTCPDSANWRCTACDNSSERGCFCKVDDQPWQPGKKCCPTECATIGGSCPHDDGVCYCPHTDSNVPYGSPISDYKCCPNWCAGPLCECSHSGCVLPATGESVTDESQCKLSSPSSCANHGSWEECSDAHWQGRCVCNPEDPSQCRCKCWYGWAGGNGMYTVPGWEADESSPALYADHCRNHCDWTHLYQPAYCATCQDADCPSCLPSGSKKCDGTHTVNAPGQ